MPTIPHEAPLLLFRERPDLVPTLLRDALGLDLPAHDHVRVEDANFAQIVPAEYRADLVLTLARDAPVMGIVVEVQLARDPRKRFTWPLYAAALHAKLECVTCLVVVAADEEIARWAAEPIGTLQAGSLFVPIVLGPARIPVVTSPVAASQFPELAVLSALAHGREPGAVDIGRVALGAAARLDEERRTLYTDLVLHALGTAGRAALEIEMDLTGYEFKSDFFKRRIAEEAEKMAAQAIAQAIAQATAQATAQAIAQATAQATAQNVLAILAARAIAVSDEVRARILACTDIPTLDQWITRAATLATAEDVVDDS